MAWLASWTRRMPRRRQCQHKEGVRLRAEKQKQQQPLRAARLASGESGKAIASHCELDAGRC